MEERGFGLTIILIGISVIFILALVYIFIAKPYKVFGSPIQPFKAEETVLGEKISYLFNKPKIGDRITFKPDGSSPDYIGIIIKVDNDITKYEVASSTGKNSWKITTDQITSKIYYPFIKDEEIKQIISQLPTSETTQNTNPPDKITDSNPLPQNSPTQVITNNSSVTPNSTNVPTPVKTSTPIPQKKTIQVSISGKLYRDNNCNSVLEQSESGISGVEVNIYQNGSTKLTTLTTDANGDYRFFKDINEDETIVLEAHSVASGGYKIYNQLSYSNVNKAAPDVTINLPRVPYESLGNCPLQ